MIQNVFDRTIALETDLIGTGRASGTLRELTVSLQFSRVVASPQTPMTIGRPT